MVELWKDTFEEDLQDIINIAKVTQSIDSTVVDLLRKLGARYTATRKQIKVRFDTTKDENNGFEILANSGEGFTYVGNMIIRITEGQRKLLKLNNCKFKLIGEDKRR